MSTHTRKRTLFHMQRLAATAALVTNVACDHACGSGYAVVDPMPTPTRKVASSMVATVTRVDGSTRIVLDVKDPTSFGATFSAKSPDASIDAGLCAGLGAIVGGRIATATPTTDGLRFEIDPDAGRGSAYVMMDVDTSLGTTTVEARISWGTSLDGAPSLTVELTDR